MLAECGGPGCCPGCGLSAGAGASQATPLAQWEYKLTLPSPQWEYKLIRHDKDKSNYYITILDTIAALAENVTQAAEHLLHLITPVLACMHSPALPRCPSSSQPILSTCSLQT